MSSTFKHPSDPGMSVYGTEENIVHSTLLKANILNNETVSGKLDFCLLIKHYKMVL